MGTESENETYFFAVVFVMLVYKHKLKYLITHVVIVQAQHLHTDIQGRQRGRKYPHNDVLFPIEI